jgi:hypothetical protein
MTYTLPQPYKCVKCDHEFMFSPHIPHPAPTSLAGDPVCPRCWDKFLAESVGFGYCTVSFKKEGSDYEIEKAKK